jgi:hypothetical protein
MKSYAEYKAFGLAAEQAIVSKLKTLDPTINKTEDEYDALDFEGEHSFIEHKQRTIASTAFNDTIIACSKAIVKDKPLYFSFGFSDGKLGYIQYTPETFEHMPTRYIKPRQRQGIVDYPKKHYLIPVKNLSWIE